MGGFRRTPAGTRYGRLVVLHDRGRGERHVTCRCDCGIEKKINVHGLWYGTTNSCGCIRDEKIAAVKHSHGKTRTLPYNRWLGMMARCYRESHPRYADYGGRGITVCERWHEFSSYYADVGDAPVGMSLDRVDNDGPYSPDNWRWATATQQNNNRRPLKRSAVCRRDHLYLPETTRVDKRGRRRCLTCDRIRSAKKKEAAA